MSPTSDDSRLHALLAAVVQVGAGLDLHGTLHRIVDAAAELADARYGALGVLNPHGEGLADFLTTGLTAAEFAAVGPLPRGRGLLGALLRDAHPIRLAEAPADPRWIGLPPEHPPIRAFLGVPLRVRDAVFGNLYLADKRGGRPFTEEDQRIVEALAAAAGVAVENARLYEDGLRRERWTAGANRITNSLLTSEDPQASLDLAARLAQSLASAAVGLVLLPGERTGLYVAHAAGSAEADVARLRGQHLPSSLNVLMLRAGHSVAVVDMGADPRVLAPVAKEFGPALAVPMISGERVLGALAVWRQRGAAPFTEQDRELAEGFARQTALALRLAEGQQDRQRLAVYRDRDRIARDLHDLVIQRLFAAGMTLQGAARRSPDDGEVRQRIDTAVDELDATIQEVRTTIYALQHDDDPVAGADGDSDAEGAGGGTGGGGLRGRVLRETGHAAGPLGFTPSVAFSGPVDTLVEEDTVRQLLPALREMLSNAARHAEASAVSVLVDATVRITPDGRLAVAGRPQDRREPTRPAVLLGVTDDGVGIPPDGRRSGLANVAARAEELGGAAWHEPGPDGRGTRVNWTAPL